MQLPLISVVMITYGHEKFLQEAIQGVFVQQTDFSIELIIANDTSPDNSDSLIKNLIKNPPAHITVKYVRHKINKGINPNFHWALSQSKGKYTAVCEGDDYWTDPLKLQKQVDFMEANPDFSLCFHLINYYNNTTKIIERIYPENLSKDIFNQEDVAKNGFIPTMSILFRNYEEKLPEYNDLKIGDYPLYLYLASKGKVKFLNFVGANYRFGVGTFSTLQKIKQQMESIKMLQAVLEKEFLTFRSRKSLEDQRDFYALEIFKKDKNFYDLIFGQRNFKNYNIVSRLKILVKLFLQ